MRRSSILFLAVIATQVFLNAQLKSPAEFLPHPYTKEFTPHHLLVDYFEHVAANSPLVRIQEIGRTNEHRPMILAFVSSAANLANLEQIRLNNLRLAGLEPGTPDMQSAKAIVWLGYTVHGNEASGAEASMQVLYDLVTGHADAESWLENTIVIMEPCVNPDGYNRYSNWNNQVSAIPFDASTIAREHDEPWPGGRVNHYLFDLNRDWAWQTQIESQNRIRAYRKWMPHVVADLHEMGYTSPYYFAPAAQPYHDFITEWQSQFQVTIGKNHAKYFDREGWAYFTKEYFDLFYPSYGDTYPVYNGAIGMTYEQGGHGFAGRAISLPNGDTLKLADRIAHHAMTSLSTIEITSLHSNSVIREFADYFTRAQENPPGQYKTYLIKGMNSKGKLRGLCRLLDLQGISYGTTSPSSRARTAYNYSTGQDQQVSVEVGDLVISAYQPRAILTQVLFDPDSRLVDSITYDITCWSLPYAYGLDAYALKEKTEVSPGYDLTHQPWTYPSNAYAYAVRWTSLTEGKLLAAALKEGLRPRYAESAFTVDGKQFGSGTVLFMRTDHRKVDGFPQKLIELSDEHNVFLESIATGFVENGKDLGSSSYRLIDLPRVLTFSGERVSTNDIGQVWYLFEQELKYPLTVVDINSLGSVNWRDYNILIMPEGYYSVPEGTMKSIQSWVSEGGKIIAIGSALSHFQDKEGFALKRFAEPAKQEEAKKAEEKDRLQLRLEAYESGERRDISTQIPGAVFKAKVDQTHPLGFGLGDHYFTLKRDAVSYEHLVGASNVVYLEGDLTYYGFAGVKALERQKNSIVFAVEQKGSGTIVYLVDNPLFRSFWENGKFVFCNALFFAGN
ncbi:MAG TPA: M14 family metallopeptidase [Saprospiraceae bacterium]|nr:M14 family metallopeptidase [Saprospiraceae bacterium]